MEEMLNVFVVVGCRRFAEGTRVFRGYGFGIAFGNNSKAVAMFVRLKEDLAARERLFAFHLT